MEQDTGQAASVEEERLDARLSEVLSLMRDKHFARPDGEPYRSRPR
jgi:hypothetical protein